MIDLTVGEFQNRIPSYVIKIAEALQKNGFEAFLVGGSIRDLLIGNIPKDFDIATNAYPENIMSIFPKSIPTGAKFGTITVVESDEKGERFDVEVTTYRSEADYFGGRWPAKVEYAKTIEEDLSRRDFTINAIALNLQYFDEIETSIQTILVDPFWGLSDIKNNIIKAVGNPVDRFSEDGLRSIRGCRLASQLDSSLDKGEFIIEPKTFNAMKDTIAVTKLVSIERFRDELLKILYRSPKPSKGIRLLKEIGALEIFIPELLEGINVEQPQFHVEDVFEHSLHTCDLAEDSIKISALFHDIGKPRTISKDEKGIHFYNHDVVGAEMAKNIMKRLRFPNSEVENVYNLIRMHMFYYPSSKWRKENEVNENSLKNIDRDLHGWSDSAIRRLIKNVGGENEMKELMKLRIADASANPKSEFNPAEIDALSLRISDVISKDMALKVIDLDITGNDLIRELNILPGANLGKLLNYLLDEVIENPLLNNYTDLISLAKNFKL